MFCPGVNATHDPALLPKMDSISAPASANVHEAVRTDVNPTAVAPRAEPTQSSSQPCQVVTKPPFSSATTVHGSWSSPVEATPSLWRTTSVTSSFGANPAPVSVASDPGA